MNKKIEILKLNLETGSVDSNNAFKAAIGQRGLNMRNVLEELNGALAEYEQGVQVNVRFSIDVDAKDCKIKVMGPTSTYQVKKALGEVSERLVSLSEIEKVYEENCAY